MKVLITGAGGLVGSEAARFYLKKGYKVFGVDNNMRAYFFGPGGDISGNLKALADLKADFKNFALDIRNSEAIFKLFKTHGPFDLIVHTAAQPSHDWAAREPLTDFGINATGTLNMLEGFRLYSSGGVFIFTSTNKVYGDTPNRANLEEGEKRYDFSPTQSLAGVSTRGISEKMSIDDSIHSGFGASKVAADIMAQEYGRYFNLNVGIFRGGCLTGPQHAAVELHGFLAYIVHCAATGKPYTIFGYRGKQVRDQIHSLDVVTAFEEFYKNPKKGVAYNLGGGKRNAASILEVIDILKDDFGLKLNHSYQGQNRVGDHICYYSDMRKFKRDYPQWQTKKSLKDIIQEMVSAYSL